MRSFSLVTSEWDERIISTKFTKREDLLVKDSDLQYLLRCPGVGGIMTLLELLVNSSDSRVLKLFSTMPCLDGIVYSIGSVMLYQLETPRLVFS